MNQQTSKRAEQISSFKLACHFVAVQTEPLLPRFGVPVLYLVSISHEYLRVVDFNPFTGQANSAQFRTDKARGDDHCVCCCLLSVGFWFERACVGMVCPGSDSLLVEVTRKQKSLR